MAIYGIYKPKYHAREKNRQNAMRERKDAVRNEEKPEGKNLKSEGNTKHQASKNKTQINLKC